MNPHATTAPWLVTSTGREHPLTGHTVGYNENAPRIEEIAHALAQINRFTGHASRPYSVAEHSLLVWSIVHEQGMGVHAQMAALLHDAHEAYTGDMSTPIKHAMGDAWHPFERNHQAMVQRIFCIRTAAASYGPAIKQADLIALATERRDLMRTTPGARPWPVLDTPGAEVRPSEQFEAPPGCTRPWTYWRDLFLAVFHMLDRQRVGNWQAIPSTPVNATSTNTTKAEA